MLITKTRIPFSLVRESPPATRESLLPSADELNDFWRNKGPWTGYISATFQTAKTTYIIHRPGKSHISALFVYKYQLSFDFLCRVIAQRPQRCYTCQNHDGSGQILSVFVIDYPHALKTIVRRLGLESVWQCNIFCLLLNATFSARGKSSLI